MMPTFPDSSRLTAAQLRQAVEFSPLAVALTDQTGQIEYVNPSYTRLTGYPPADVLGQLLPVLAPGALPAEIHQDLWQHLTSGQVWQGDLPNQRKSTETYWAFMVMAPLTDAQGALSHIVVFAEDLTPRQQAQAALHASEAFNRSIIETSLDSIALLDLEGNLQFMNVSGKRLLQIDDLAPHLNRSYAALWRGSLHGPALEALALARDSDYGLFEGQCPTIKGEVRWWSVIISALRGASGQPERLLAIAHDITPYRQALLALQESEARFRAIFEQAAVGICQTDLDGRFIRVNQRFCDIVGYRASELRQMTFDDITHPADLEAGLENTGRLITGEIDTCTTEKRYQRKDDTTVWVELTLALMRAADGAPQYFVAVAEDITRRRQAEEEIRQLNAQLEHRVIERTAQLGNTISQLEDEVAVRQRVEATLHQEQQLLSQRVAERTQELSAANAELAHAVLTKDEFLATMSHELRSPLNAILNTAEALEEEVYGPLTGQQRKSLHIITESGQHLLSLINDILDLSKTEAGKLSLEILPVEVDAVCQASLRLVRQQAHKTGLRLVYRRADQAQLALADERRLKQILVNLLSNAVKFTPNGGEVGLEVTADEELQTLNFTVWDTGIGIAPDDMPRLFKPFMQLNSGLARQYAGTGLGLALVQRMTELQGGTVIVHSAPNHGSRFTVSLPMLIEAPPAPLAAEPVLSEPGAAGPADTAPLILLAEDTDVIIESVSDYLRACGYRVTVARNGQEAVALAVETPPALILMDIQMPVLDGLAAIQHLRAIPSLALIPIVAWTALVMPGDSERCLAAGANEYLSKPIRLKKLRHILTTYLSATALPAGGP